MKNDDGPARASEGGVGPGDEVVPVAPDAAGGDRALRGLDRIANVALDAGSVSELLMRLLQVLVQTLPAIDTAAILLREGECLRLRAAVGLEGEVDAGFTLAIGEGFAGAIAAEGRPKLIEDGGPDPRIKSPVQRKKGVRVLYGVPLVDGSEVIGVAHIGSLSAQRFSDEDKGVLSALASRASTAIARHVLRERIAARARQQEAVAALSMFALETVNVTLIFQRAVEAVAATLGVKFAQILELLPTGRSFVLRAGVGWAQGLVGRAVIPATPDTHAGATLSAGGAVLIEDLGADARFAGSPLFAEHDIASGISVLIPAAGEHARPFGVLAAHARAPRAFSADDEAFLRAVANVVATAIARRSAETELRAAESRLAIYPEQVRLLSVLADAVPLLVSYVDRDLRYRFNNKAYERWFGRSRDDITGKHVRDVVGETAYEQLAPYLEGALAGKTMHYEQEVVYTSGRRWVEGTYLPDLGPGGEVLGFVAIVTDSTEKKRAQRREQQARAAAEEALASVNALLSSSLVGIGFIDTDLRYVRVNAALAAMNGVPVEAHIGHTVREVLGRHVESIDVVEALLRQVLDRGEPLPNAELTTPVAGYDAPRSFLASYFPVRTQEGQVLGIGAAVMDVTERKRMEQELRDAAKAREELLAVVSHDLKNPLGAIHLAAAYLLRKPLSDPAQRKQAEVIHRAADRMDHLIRDLLDVAGIRAGRLAIDRMSEDVDALIDEAVDTYQAAATERGVSLLRAASVAAERVWCDRERILQVFGNLLGNAIKFCRRGDTVTIGSEVVGREVRYEVADTGPGIPEEDRSHIFEPYWSATSHGKKGTGLGLYISKAIVEAHGGRLWAESDRERGAQFYFTLPLAAS
jgi:PAS domain S-box-containing protein